MHHGSLPLTFLIFSQVLEAMLISAGNAAWSPASRQLAMAQHPLNKEFVVSFGCLTTWNVSYHLQLHLYTKQALLDKASGRSCHACCTKLRLSTTFLLLSFDQMCVCLLRIRSLCISIACAGTHASCHKNHPSSCCWVRAEDMLKSKSRHAEVKIVRCCNLQL